MRNYHIVRVVPLVNLTLRNMLENDPKLTEMSYREIQDFIFGQHFNYGDGFSHEMRALGNRCEELVFDCEILQRKWAEENDVNIDFSAHWQLKVVLEQLKRLNPDIVFLQGFTRVTPRDIQINIDLFPNVKKVAVHSGYPGMVEGFTKDTFVFCGLPMICDIFTGEGIENSLLYHGFDERLVTQVNHIEKDTTFSFIGSSGYGYGLGHKVRYWELLKLANNTDFCGWLDDRDDFFHSTTQANPFSERPLKSQFYDIDSTDWETYPNPLAPLRYFMPEGKALPPVYGIEYYQTLARSLMTYHRHGDIAQVGAMRLFEATGVGTCLLTNNGDNLSSLYDDGTELLTYSSLRDCVEKVNYLTEHPEKALEIGKNGQAKTLAKHTLRHRYRDAHEQLQKCLG